MSAPEAAWRPFAHRLQEPEPRDSSFGWCAPKADKTHISETVNGQMGLDRAAVRDVAHVEHSYHGVPESLRVERHDHMDQKG